MTVLYLDKEIRTCPCGANFVSAVCPRCGAQPSTTPAAERTKRTEKEKSAEKPSRRDAASGKAVSSGSEHLEQVELIERVHGAVWKYPELEYLFAIPNGGQRNRATAGKLKAEGVKPGVSDLFLPVPRGRFHGLWIEMKYGMNKPTAEQLAWMDAMRRFGYRCEVCWSADEAWTVIEEYLMDPGSRTVRI